MSSRRDFGRSLLALPFLKFLKSKKSPKLLTGTFKQNGLFGVQLHHLHENQQSPKPLKLLQEYPATFIGSVKEIPTQPTFSSPGEAAQSFDFVVFVDMQGVVCNAAV